MTPQSAFTALVELALMLAVGVASIVAAVGIVGLVISVLGEVLFNTGWAGVPAMARRSAIGAFGWGVIIAVAVWAGRYLLALQQDGAMTPERFTVCLG
jgi:hypothetical protein